MIRRPPRSTLFPSRRSSDLDSVVAIHPSRTVHVVDYYIKVPIVIEVRQRHALADRLAVKPPSCETVGQGMAMADLDNEDRKSTRPNSSHDQISYAGLCLKKK